MKVIICGSGQVGFGIAQRLCAEKNDVTIIDTSAELVRRVSETLDVRALVGHASRPDVLDRAGAGDADMIIAVTLSDEVNMVACQVAHSLFNVTTKIARIRAQSYLEPQWQDMFARDQMPIDVIISPEEEAAETVLRRLSLPGAFETLEFLDNRAVFAGVHCKEDCPIINTPLNQLTDLFPDLDTVIVAIERDGDLFIPGGLDQLQIGDEVFFTAEQSQVERTLSIFGHEEALARRIVIAGGGNIGHYVALKLEKTAPQVTIKLIEQNRERAEQIAGSLNKTVILHGDCLDQDVLREARISNTETFVALTNIDNVNILSCVMAKELGCTNTVSLLNEVNYSAIAAAVGIDTVINPRATTVSSILQYVRKGRIRAAHSVLDGRAEVIEAEAMETSPLVDKPLRESGLPDGVHVGAILHGDELIIPRGETVIRTGDRVVIFSKIEHVHDVERMFRVSLEYF